jgi:hypothetical protein
MTQVRDDGWMADAAGQDRPEFCTISDDLQQVGRTMQRSSASVADVKRAVHLIMAILRKAAEQAPHEISGAVATIRDAYGLLDDAVQRATSKQDVTRAVDSLSRLRSKLDAAGNKLNRYVEQHCA